MKRRELLFLLFLSYLWVIGRRPLSAEAPNQSIHSHSLIALASLVDWLVKKEEGWIDFSLLMNSEWEELISLLIE